MDDLVRAALAKWPNVPHCHGWLGLDARGHWYMRDDRTQAAGPFAPWPGEPGTGAKGSMLRHDKLIAFIHRNYAADENGQWFFQNGPQRVYVELEFTPYIWRLQPDGSVWAHTGVEVSVQDSLLDEHGRLYLVTTEGVVGLVHSADMALAAEQVESGCWTPKPAQAAELPGRFGYEPSPERRKRYGPRLLQP